MQFIQTPIRKANVVLPSRYSRTHKMYFATKCHQSWVATIFFRGGDRRTIIFNLLFLTCSSDVCHVSVYGINTVLPIVITWQVLVIKFKNFQGPMLFSGTFSVLEKMHTFSRSLQKVWSPWQSKTASRQRHRTGLSIQDVCKYM